MTKHRRNHLVRSLCATSLALASLTGSAFAQRRVGTPAVEQMSVAESRCGATDVEASVGRRIGLPAPDQSYQGGRRGYTPVVTQDVATGGRRVGSPAVQQGSSTGRRSGSPAPEQGTAGRRVGTPAAEQCAPWDAPKRVRAQVPTQDPYGTAVQPLIIDAYGYEWAMAVTDPSQVPGFWSTYSCGEAVFASDDGHIDVASGWVDWETFSCVYLNAYYAY